MKKNNHDADYDRWGGAPGSIKVTKAPNKKTAKSSSATAKKGKKK